VYAIKDWNEIYNRMRKDRDQPKRLEYIPVISKLHGPRYRWLVEQKGGLAAFGLFVALLEVVGDGHPPRDGRLADSDGRPYDITDLRRATGINESEIKIGLELLTCKRLGWVTDDSRLTDT